MMEKRRKAARFGSVFLLSLVLSAGAVITASAADTTDLDMAKSGSISLVLADSDGNTVSGGAVTLYEVADLYLDDGDMAYEMTDAFSGYSAEIDAEDTGLAADLTAYVDENGISGTTTAIGSDGEVSFDGLALGMYLVVQTAESEDYEAISPFVVTVPIEEDGVWVYDVDASPKVGTVTLTETEEETPPPTETTETTQTEEIPTTTAETLSSTLPQTGQLNWPIPVLAAGGVFLTVMGRHLARSGRKNGYAS